VGKVDATLTWTLPQGADDATLYLTVWNNGFVPGTFLAIPLASGGASPASSLNYTGLAPNTTYYWKVASKVNGNWYDSATVNFSTRVCQVNSGLAYDLSRSGYASDVDAYVNEFVSDPNEVEPKYKINLRDALHVGLSGESGGGGDCAYHVDYLSTGPHPTFGVLQFDISTWQSGPKTNPDGSNEALNYYDSGSLLDVNGIRKTFGCWKVPGRDTTLSPDPMSATFGGTNDANIWDPYAQVREAAAYIRDGQISRWTTVCLYYFGSSKCP
jgi:hypothetical protein